MIWRRKFPFLRSKSNWSRGGFRTGRPQRMNGREVKASGCCRLSRLRENSAYFYGHDLRHGRRSSLFPNDVQVPKLGVVGSNPVSRSF